MNASEYLHRHPRRIQRLSMVSRSTIALFVCTTGFLITTSCDRKNIEDQVGGQVFVSLQNGSSVKLGSIPILVIETASAKATLLELQRGAQREIETYQRLIDVNEELKSKLRDQDLESKRERFEMAWLVLTVGSPDMAEARRLTGVSNTSQIKTTLDALRRAAQESSVKERDANAAIDQAKMLIESLHRPKCYFTTNFPGVHRIVTTDADGKFHTTVPRYGNWSVVAFGTRIIGVESVDLFWMVATSGENRTNLLLNSSNLFQE